MSDLTPDPARFPPDALLMFRTDWDGIIQTASPTFLRTVGYTEEEVIGQSVRMFRHADMPQAVYYYSSFALFEGRPVGAYTKSAAKDGADYWSFAIATPVDGGVFSIQMNPRAEILREVVPIYRDICAGERAGTLSVEDSARALEAAIRARLNLRDYDAYMSYALSRECRKRDLSKGRAAPPQMRQLREIYEMTLDVAARAAEVDAVFRETAQIRYNMRLQAGRLEGRFGPIGVISENHKVMRVKIEQDMRVFRDSAALGSDQIAHAAFATAVRGLADELVETIRADPRAQVDAAKWAVQDLQFLSEKYAARLADALSRLKRNAASLHEQCRRMRRVVSGLELTRIMCKIERARVYAGGEGLDEIVQRLERAERDLTLALSSIEKTVKSATSIADQLSEKRRTVLV